MRENIKVNNFYIVVNTETGTVVTSGNESDCTYLAQHYNNIYQTNAYKIEKWITNGLQMDEIINAIATIRSHLATQPFVTREMSHDITKLDDAMLWMGLEYG